MKNHIALITGGARSGKSRMALEIAAREKQRIFVATAEPLDAEMDLRIRKHRAERGPDWKTIEEPLHLAEVVNGNPKGAMVIDCLTLWLSNWILREQEDSTILHCIHELASAVSNRAALTVLVTNEVGMGIVPDNDLARRFRDLAGTMNQSFAEIATTVVLTVSGLPLFIKDKRKEI